MSSVISTSNSSVNLLSIGGTFTGISEDVSGYGSISVSVFSDVSSAADGLKIQFATNGTIFDVETSVTVAANISQVVEVNIAAKIFRIIYVNGTTPQTVFRLRSSLVLSSIATDSNASKILDYDTGAGTDDVPTFGVLLPSSGGAVAGGTITNPINVDFGGTVRDLAANDALNVAIVDSAGDQITTFGGGTQYTVNAVAPSDPIGPTLVSERDDQLSTLTEAEGDWTNARSTSKGALWVAIADVSGDPITSFGGGTQYTEDDVAVANPVGTQLISRRRDVLASEVTTDGDVIAVNSTSKGELYVKHVDTIPVTDNGGSITVDNGGTFAVQAAQSGTWTVEPGNTANTTPWLTSLHDGTTKASILDLTNNNPLTVALVDLNGDQISSFGGGTQYTEDAAAAANPVGTQLISRRRDSLVSEVTTDGDVIAVNSTSKGELYVKHIDSIPVTDGGGSLTVDGTVIVQGDVGTISQLDLTNSNPLTVAIVDSNGDQISSFGGGTQYTEDVAAAANPIGTMLMAVRADSLSGVTTTDGDNIAARATDNGELYVKHIDAIPVTDNGGSLTIDGTITANAGSGTFVVDGSGVTQPVSIAGTVVVSNAVLSVVGGGTEATAQRVTIASDSTGVLSIDDNGSSITVDNGGTFAVQASLSAAIPAGNNVIGQVKLTDGTDIADILDLTNSNPLTVAIVDANGDQITSFLGGTQYTEDVAAAANPIGTVLIAIRSDVPSAETTTDGDNIAARATNKGELYVKHIDAIPVTDNGGSLTIDGTVTADAGSGVFIVDGSGVTQPVSIAGTVVVSNAVLSVVGGGTEATAQRVTIASDSTGVLSIDDNGSSITVDGTVTSNAGTGFPSVQTEDVASAGGETGLMILGVRNDAAASKTTTDGDFSAIATDAAGRVGIADLGGSISVDDNAGSLTIDNSTLAVVGGGTEATALRVTIASDSTGVLSIDDNGGSLTVDGTVAISGTVTTTNASVQVDDAAFTPATSSVTMVGATFDDVAPDSVNEGDGGAIRMSANRNLYTTLRDAAGNERGVNVSAGNALLVDASATTQPVSNTVLSVVGGGTEATAQRVTIASDSTGVLSIDDNGGSLTVDNAVLSVVGGGTEATALRVTIASDSTGVLSVDDNGSSLTVDNGGTFAVQATIAAGATSIAKAEDVASVTGDVGVPAMAIQRATPADTAADLDYSMLQMSAGRLWTSATIDTALPAGTNAIGKLAANSGVTIGAIEIAAAQTLATVSTVTNLSQQGGVAIALNTGVRAAGVQRVTIATDDLVPVSDNGGSLTVDNGGTFAVQATIAAGATNIAKAQDAAFVIGNVGVPALVIQTLVPSNVAGTDGDYDMLQMYNGRLWTSATIDAALPAGGNTIGAINIAAAQTLSTVSTVTNLSQMAGAAIAMGTGVRAAGVQRVTIATDDLVPVSDNGGSLTVDNAALSVIGGGVEATALRVTIASDSTGVLSVDDNGSSLTVDNNGTFVVQATIAAGATSIAKEEDVASASGDVGVPAMAIQTAIPVDTASEADYSMLQMSNGRLFTSTNFDKANLNTATLQNAATSEGDGSTLDVSGYSTVVFTVTGNFWAGINLEATTDDTNWFSIHYTFSGDYRTSEKDELNEIPITVAGLYVSSVVGFKTVRARISAYKGGQITVTGRASVVPRSPNIVQIGGVAVLAGYRDVNSQNSESNPVATQDLRSLRSSEDLWVMNRDLWAASLATRSYAEKKSLIDRRGSTGMRGLSR